MWDIVTPTLCYNISIQKVDKSRKEKYDTINNEHVHAQFKYISLIMIKCKGLAFILPLSQRRLASLCMFATLKKNDISFYMYRLICDII
jgi:hypothetical protein